MSCSEYQEFFSDLFDGSLEGDRRRGLETHLTACAECRREYDAFRKGITALHTTASIEVPDRFVEAVTTTMKIERVAPPAELAPARPPSTRTVSPEPVVIAARAGPSWVPVGFAAAIVVAFAFGYLLMRSGAQDEFEKLRRDLAALKEFRAPAPPVKLPNNVAIVNGQEIPLDTFILDSYQKEGLIRVGEGWVAKAYKEKFEQNERLVADEKKRLEKEIADLKAAPAAPAITHERAMDYLGLEKVGEYIVERRMAQALRNGTILMSDGQFKTPDQLRDEIMAKHNLVHHEGRWMSAEQRDSMLAQQYVRRSDLASDTPVARLLDGLRIGPPVSHDNLTVYPLLADRAGDAGVTTLHEALAAGKAEISDTAGALSVRVKNEGAVELLVLGGTVLVGGRFGRVVARDTLVPAGKTVDVRVYDAEPGGPMKTSEKFAKESGQHLVTGGVRRALAADAGQGYVWHAVASQLAGLRRAVGPADAYKAHADAVAKFRARFEAFAKEFPQAVGVAVAIGNSLEYVEIFASAPLFQACWDRILAAAALESVWLKPDVRGGTIPNTFASVKYFVESAFACEIESVEGAVALRAADGGAAGRGVLREDAAVHLSLFVPTEAPAPQAALEISAAKVQRILEDYEKRVDTAPPLRKAAVVREIAALPQKRATQVLLARINDADLTVRRAAIEALGGRDDADAVKPLLKLFKESRRDLPTFGAAADALARLGHEDAVAPMLDVLEGREAQLASVVAIRIPTLLLQQRRDDVLERAVARMIDALEKVHDRLRQVPQPQFDPESGYHVALTAALRSTTGQNFSDPVDFRRWWNEPLNRRKFLEERQKP